MEISVQNGDSNDEFQNKLDAIVKQHKVVKSKILIAESTCYKSYDDVEVTP